MPGPELLPGSLESPQFIGDELADLKAIACANPQSQSTSGVTIWEVREKTFQKGNSWDSVLPIYYYIQ
jgi:hypothetical protein